DDIHSPRQQGFIWSHLLWFMTREAYGTDYRVVKDWVKFPELRFLERHDSFAPIVLAAAMFGFGEAIGRIWPSSGTSGLQMFVWASVISTVALYHATFAINSLAHTYGSRRYETNDDSRNNLWLALLTFGEGWHNNHHYFPASARQGFRWWEIDISYYLLVLMSWFGLVWDLKPVPARVLDPSQQLSVKRSL
ncbi:MAG: fatty acid desaturase, partial [Planctomycetota bacterium]